MTNSSDLFARIGIALALSFGAGCGDAPSATTPDAGSADAPRDDAALAGDAPDAPDAADPGPTYLAPTWQRSIPGVGAFLAITTAGDEVAVAATRVDPFGADPIVIAEDQPGQLTLTDAAQSAVLWLDGSGTVVAGRVIAERTTATIGGATARLIESDHDGGVLVGGGLVGQMRFLPGTSATRVESALAPSVSLEADDPFAIRFDASATPTTFARGTTTALATSNFNRISGVASLPDGDTVLVGDRQSSTYALAGTTVPTGVSGYLARVTPTGEVAWMLERTGTNVGETLHTSATGEISYSAGVRGTATLFAGTSDELSITATEDASQLVVARLTDDGGVAWARTIVPSQISYVHTTPLADGGVLAAVPTNLAASFEVRDPTGTVLTTGITLGHGTLLFRFAADGTLQFTKQVPWSLESVVELGDGRIAAIASWYTDAPPLGAPPVTFPAGVDPAEHPVYAIQTFAADGDDLSLALVGISPSTIATALGSNTVVLATQPLEHHHIVDASGSFVPTPACERAQCLFVASYTL